MYKLFISIAIVTIFFSACSTNSDCYTSYSVHYVNWGNGTGMQPVFTPSYSYKLCEEE